MYKIFENKDGTKKVYAECAKKTKNWLIEGDDPRFCAKFKPKEAEEFLIKGGYFYIRSGKSRRDWRKLR